LTEILNRIFHRSLLIIPLILLLIMLYTAVSDPLLQSADPYLGNRYIATFYEQTGSYNGVDAILLDYRVFDSVFEAGLLLISVTGVIYMVKNG